MFFENYFLNKGVVQQLPLLAAGLNFAKIAYFLR